MKIEYELDYKQFTRQNRQWPRHLRIAHAMRNLRQAKSPEAQAFWHRVCMDNGAFE